MPSQGVDGALAGGIPYAHTQISAATRQAFAVWTENNVANPAFVATQGVGFDIVGDIPDMNDGIVVGTAGEVAPIGRPRQAGDIADMPTKHGRFAELFDFVDRDTITCRNGNSLPVGCPRRWTKGSTGDDVTHLQICCVCIVNRFVTTRDGRDAGGRRCHDGLATARLGRGGRDSEIKRTCEACSP